MNLFKLLFKREQLYGNVKIENGVNYKIVECKACHKKIQGKIFHLGFSDRIAFYCSKCENVLLIGNTDFDDTIPLKNDVFENYGNNMIPYWKKVEEHLSKCECGGNYGFFNLPKCPECKEPIFGDIYENKVVLKNREGYVFVSGKYYDFDENLNG